MVINGMKISPESISDLDAAGIFNLECLLLGEREITLVVNNEQSESTIKCM